MADDDRVRIMVLNDRETWTTVNGCMLVETTENEIMDAMDESRTPSGVVLARFNADGDKY